MAKNYRFRAQRSQRQTGVLQRLAFLDARAQARNQSSVGAQPLCGQLEAGAGARGRLVEKQGDTALGKNAVPYQRVFVFQNRGASEDPAHALQTQVRYR